MGEIGMDDLNSYLEARRDETPDQLEKIKIDKFLEYLVDCHGQVEAYLSFTHTLQTIAMFMRE